MWTGSSGAAAFLAELSRRLGEGRSFVTRCGHCGCRDSQIQMVLLCNPRQPGHGVFVLLGCSSADREDL